MQCVRLECHGGGGGGGGEVIKYRAFMDLDMEFQLSSLFLQHLGYTLTRQLKVMEES